MAISGAVYARIVSQYSDKGSKAAQRDIQKTAAKIDKFNKRIVKSYLVAGAAVAAFGLKLTKDAVQGAMADQKQQAALAVALRNTTGATEAAIAANVEYLDSLELQVAIDNEELIPALQNLVTATGDLALSQQLLTLATDVSAASGKDLSSVSTALSRAFGGNFTALTRLGLPLDQAAVKSKDLIKILDQLAKISKGQASAAASTFAGTMEVLRLKVNQVLDRVGYALMPVIEEFANYIITDVIPNIEKWVELNETKLVKSFESIISMLESFAKNFLAILLFIEKYRVLIGIIAAIPFISLITNQVILLGGIARGGAKFVQALYKAFKTKLLPVLASVGRAAAAVGTVFTTGGLGLGFRALLSALGKVFKPLGIALALLGGLAAIGKKITGSFGGDAIDKVTKSLSSQAEASRTATRANRLSRAELKKKIEADKKAAAALKAAAAAQAKALAEQKKSAKFQADYQKINERIAKEHKVKLLSSDEEKLVQITAAEALLKRQAKNNTLDKERLKNLKEEVLLQKVRNNLALRYEDILKALADGEVSSKDIAILAGKWGVTTEAAEAYVKTIFAIEDGTISNDEVIELAKSWGSTQAQAAQYLDFFTYLNDGVLSDAEIEKLKTKWKMTEEQVRMYADFVGVVNDGKLTDAEIVKIQGKWKLTTDQVVDYIKKIGSPVSYSGTLIDPAKAAEIGWLSATAALQKYLDLLNAGTGAVTTTVTDSTTNTNGNSAASIAAAAIEAVEAADAAAEAANAVAESEAALAKSMQEAADAAAASAKFTEELTKQFPEFKRGLDILEGQMAAKEASGRSYTTDAEMDRILAGVGGFGSKFGASGGGYDEGFRFKAFSPTMNTASGGSFQNSMAGNTTVNVTVQGSVTSEQDLVTTIRNGLLSQQYNGDSINLQAI